MDKTLFALSPLSNTNLITIDTLEKIERSSNTLWFNGIEVEFPPALFAYVELDSRFTPVLDRFYESIRKQFDENFLSIEDIATKTDDFLNAIFNPLTDFAVKQLSILGCYDTVPDIFFHRYVEPKFEKILRIKEECINQIYRIETEQDERNQMRTARRKAAVEASKYNDGWADLTNLGHGIFNLTARIADATENAKEREKLFEMGKSVIKNELEWICSDMAGSVAQALYKSTGLDIRDPRTPEDYKKAEVIFKNLKSGNIAKAHLIQAAAEVFSLNPQEDGFLPWCVEQFDDLSGDFETAANIFHVDIVSTKRKILEAVINLNTEEDALASKKALEDLQIRLSFTDHDLADKVEEALLNFSLEYRTINGVVYPTKEEANLAYQELEKVNGVIKEYPLDNPEQCQSFLNAIAALNLKTAVADSIVEAVQERSFQQKNILIEIVKKYKLSQNNATALLTRHSVLTRSELANLKIFDLIDTSTADMAKPFNILEDDIVLAFIDIYNTPKRGGLLVSQKGIYSLFVPPVIIKIISKNKWDKGKCSMFTPFSDIAISLSDNKKKLFLRNGVYLPYNQTQEYFEQLKVLVKTLQELRL